MPASLHCLPGRAVPPPLAADLARVLDLPSRARESLWRALGPCLASELPPDLDARLDRFCAETGASPDDLGRVIKACRTLLRGAGGLDLDWARLLEDLAALSGRADEIAAVLQPGYERAKALVRTELYREALRGHGKVLEGATTRVDLVTAVEGSDGPGLAVGVLTLEIREGDRTERLTLQVTPAALGALGAACARLERIKGR